LPEQGARILAVDEKGLLLSGERLWSMDPATGAVDSHWGDAVISGAGQGVVAGDVIFWPNGADIVLVDRLTGQPTASLPLPEGGAVNLVVAGARAEHLVAAGATHLTVYRRTDADTADEPQSSNSE
jgi:hypothetical protein